MNTDTKIILGAIVLSVLVIVGAIFLIGSGESKSPKRETLGSASMMLDKNSEDFGSMKSDEERTATFTITNTSDAVLRIWNIATSCDCTFASIIINGQKTGEFNMAMHMSSTLKNWIGEIPPKQTAQLEVTYRPKVMPVTGAVTRQVNFATNDPQHAEVEVSIKANVL
ncbi:MAG: hypothetical protein UV61_C0009G0034 [Candidatus Gottesmanbacteria bacterium GW2011_GWB1_43_11]|uniref:DUF1573 domain-containing protein n=1 Tax=Candidatus Gottesmanbacteria bacterium GW2011_GWB1_43_11 TaxID=1618446 RepID=A0A0G1CLX2_9BACT|nr:MAG: hypothetical protein UV17_C0031G0005 [Candidatus Gottesmanbacteria bacterium GW2011_GWA1_42_26]KKS81388.1 MAG: hypothetical protein UV55_C0015G0034 [Candidatus Gottesmanbacteria bacterium GW2011_GWC1_43_10]KKS86507.1 MAG: hypothetical protein UV61_C0009G0034 [Candidatus Gottesmanbacteria bacterium GW2011_GWB1_43_11]OGG07464.1 MAG: hypothetical protein A2699_03055 [Candidatus Gottesmanbacteria bacterium RIFCSPHIGHO2_01_FULL_43_15]OGG26510.1 MAG: hypothetical protein A3A59_06150 [Candidat